MSWTKARGGPKDALKLAQERHDALRFFTGQFDIAQDNFHDGIHAGHERVKSIEELLVSAGRQFPLVTVHREGINPDVCWFGRVLGIERGRVSLLEVTPDATWEEKPESFRLSEITRVSFGGDYETALHLVGGHPGQAIQTVQRTGASRSAYTRKRTSSAAGSRR